MFALFLMHTSFLLKTIFLLKIVRVQRIINKYNCKLTEMEQIASQWGNYFFFNVQINVFVQFWFYFCESV
jgi:hypothetical protein